MRLHVQSASRDCPSSEYVHYVCFDFFGCCKSNPCFPPASCPPADRPDPISPIELSSPSEPRLPETVTSYPTPASQSQDQSLPHTSEPKLPEISKRILSKALILTRTSADSAPRVSTATGNPQTTAPTSDSPGKPHDGLAGEIVGGVVAAIFILLILFGLWTTQKHRRSIPIAGDYIITEKSFEKANELAPRTSIHTSTPKAYHQLRQDDAEVAYGNEISTRPGTPRRLSISDLPSHSTFSQEREPGNVGTSVALNEDLSSTTEASHLTPCVEMLASIPPRENVTHELPDMKNHFRVDIPLHAENNLINKWGKFWAVPATACAATLGVTPQLSLTTPEGVVFGSNQGVNRSLSARAVQHVMGFMSFRENIQQRSS
ncbi:hypothetical protein AJ78_00309 [Emergomyces pasteurianus Ep9510]|uniref:Uncharacterized protein n=1 Tax=Emergomyces pasteurianus Ep9510 TaxID=1447872 RepID=A0A1J9PTS6_9EURO|nr:hypothetical protein AJ78_00309 [Emergomyces pasteurianus Ep9510]